METFWFLNQKYLKVRIVFIFINLIKNLNKVLTQKTSKFAVILKIVKKLLSKKCFNWLKLSRKSKIGRFLK